MAIPLALMAAGTAMQVIGNWQANMDQASAEAANAKFYEEQATFARDAMFRQLDIANSEYTAKIGAQVTGYARNSVDMSSGSVTNNIAGSLAKQTAELVAIRRKGAMEVSLARLRGTQAMDTAKTLSSTSYNLFQAGTSVFRNAAASSDTWGVGLFQPLGGGQGAAGITPAAAPQGEPTVYPGSVFDMAQIAQRTA